MTEQGKQDIIDYLKSLQSNQNFTIGELVRFLGDKRNEPFTIFEVEKYEKMEEYLLQEKLINDTGNTTKLYNKTNKVKTL